MVVSPPNAPVPPTELARRLRMMTAHSDVSPYDRLALSVELGALSQRAADRVIAELSLPDPR